MYDRRNIKSAKKTGRILFLVLLILLFWSSYCVSSPEGADNAAAVKSPAKMITGIMITGNRTASTDETGKILISANQELNYTSVKQYDPIGVILFFPDTSLGGLQPEYTPDSNIIASIKTSMSPDQGNARLEVVLKKDLAYSVKRMGTDIEISFQGGQISPPMAQAPAPSVISDRTPVQADSGDQTDLDEGQAQVTGTPEVQTPSAEGISTTPSSVNRIDFLSKESGKSSIIIGTTHPVKYEIDKISQRTLKVSLANCRLPEFRKHRPLITTRFESAVDRITPVQKDTGTDVIIELRQWVPYRPVQEDNLLTVYFDASSIGPRPFEAAQLPLWQQVLDEVTIAEAEEEGGAAVPDKIANEEEQYLAGIGKQKHYTGQKIALDFYKIDIKNVFRIIQQVSGKNYAIDKNVNGEVTIFLEKPVPWDQALDLVLRMNQLGKIEQGDIVRIATQATLKQEEQLVQQKLVALRKRKAEQRKLEPLLTEYIPINYANAGSEILPHIQSLLTKERGNASVDHRNNQLILTDTKEVLEKAHEVITNIDKVTPQVIIEARIVEVNDHFVREVGLSLNVSGEDIYRSDLNGQYSYGIALNNEISATPAGEIGFNFTRLDAWGTPVVLDAALKAMESEGTGKIISSPKILTLDNKQALIKQGERIPYQTVEDDDVEIEWEDIDLLLNVIPHVTPDKRISMVVKVTKNEITGYIPTGEPRISTNEVETEFLVNDGETIVIGGVVKRNLTFDETGFPLLKDIPMIGWLFKSVKKEDKKKEMLIFLTPTIIQLEQKRLVQVEN
ncbi:MAG: type IV pilus secretin PilQ [Dissulfuribacterales bacterium]